MTGQAVSLVRLTWFEALHLVRGPFVGPLVALAIAYSLFLTALDLSSIYGPPTWTTVNSTGVDAVTYPAYSLIVAVSVATYRDARYGRSTVAPVSARSRTLAVLLAGMAVGALVGALLYGGVCALYTLASPLGIAGYTTAAQVLAFVLLPAAAGIVGAAMAALFRSWVPTLVIALFVVVTEAVNLSSYSVPTGNGQELWVPEFSFWSILGTDFEVLPVSIGAWRLGLIICAAVLSVCLLALRTPDTLPRPRLRVAAGILGGAALLLGCLSYSVQSEPERWAQTRLPFAPQLEEPSHTCEEHSGVTYCAYDAYAAWIPLWVAGLQPVVDAVPDQARQDLPTLRQSFHSPDFSEPYGSSSEVALPDSWVIEEGETTELYTRSEFATAAVGLPTDWDPDWEDEEPCPPVGQARAPLAMWLIVHDAADRDFALWEANDWIWFWTDWPTTAQTDDLAAGYALLDAPPDAVRDGVREHWDILVDPSTSTVEAMELLDIVLTEDHYALAADFLQEHTLAFEPSDEFGEDEVTDSHLSDPDLTTTTEEAEESLQC